MEVSRPPEYAITTVPFPMVSLRAASTNVPDRFDVVDNNTTRTHARKKKGAVWNQRGRRNGGGPVLLLVLLADPVFCSRLLEPAGDNKGSQEDPFVPIEDEHRKKYLHNVMYTIHYLQ